MKIGGLVQRTGLALSRIRFYERVGLLTVKRLVNGYRSYPEEAVLTLRWITIAQKAGFSLDEPCTLLPIGQAFWEHGALIDTLRRKVQDIEALQAQFVGSRMHLRELMEQPEATPTGMDCATNAPCVLSEMRLGMEEGSTPTWYTARQDLRWT